MTEKFRKGDIISSYNKTILNKEIVDVDEKGVEVKDIGYCLKENIKLIKRKNNIKWFFRFVFIPYIKKYYKVFNGLFNYKIIIRHKDELYD